MKNKFKRVLSLILCLVILCCPFANIATSAHAIVPVLAADGVLMILTYVCGLVGVSFLSNADLVTAQTQFLADNPSIASYLETTANASLSLVDGQWKFHFSKEIFTYFTTTLIPAIQKYFSRAKEQISYEILDQSQGMIGQVKFTYKQSFSNAQEAIAYAQYDIDDTLTLTVNSVIYTIQKVESMSSDGTVGVYSISRNGTLFSNSSTSLIVSRGEFYNFDHWGIMRYGFMLTGTTTKYLCPFFAYTWYNKSGVLQYGYRTFLDCTNQIAVSGEGINDVVLGIDSIKYQYAIDYSLSEFNLALQKALASFEATLDIPFDINREVVEKGKAEIEDPTQEKVPYVPDWALWWDKLGIKELIESVKQNTSVTEQDISMPNLPTSIKDKFPFCVPFDLYYMIQKLNATGAAPKWDIPFKIQSLGINQTIPLDLSGWESVAAVCRWAFTLLFILALVLLTRNIIRA